MKTSLIVFLAALVSASPALADKISCGFTEPFFSLEIDTDAKTLKKTEPDWAGDSSQIVTTILSRQVKINRLPAKKVSKVLEIPRYQVIADGKPVLVLELSYQGSDGMSDFAYPYSTEYGGNHGGCESDKVKRHVFHHEEEPAQ